MTEPCDMTAVEARRLIGVKRLAPSELLASCIARIEAVDHAVNAIPARDFDRARAAAKRADEAVAQGGELPALHGLPIGIKDLEETGGLVTTHGSVIFKDHVPQEDERIVAAVRAAGAIVIGKTNTPEFGAGANTRNAVYGVTANPFDPEKSAAGSSGGSAVALAAGMVPLCTGSDTGGSLRNPASFSGIVGFRLWFLDLCLRTGAGLAGRICPCLVPWPGRWLTHACFWAPSRPTTSAIRWLIRCMGGPFWTAGCVLSARRDRSFAASGRVDPDFGFAPTERHISEIFAEKTGLFRHVFARAENATPDCSGTDESFEILRSLAFLSAHAEKVRVRPNDVGSNVRANVAEGQRYTAADVARAMTVQTQVYRRWQTFFQHHDVILTPSITISPRSWRELYPAEIDGNPTRTYFHWLALAYPR